MANLSPTGILTIALTAIFASGVLGGCAERVAGAREAADAKLSVVNDKAYYPEGAVLIDGVWMYAEMSADRITSWKEGANGTVWRQDGCGPTAVAASVGGLYVDCHQAHLVVRLTEDGRGGYLPVPEATFDIRRPNDIVSDGRGGAFVSSSGEFSLSAPSTGAIYHIYANGESKRAADGIWYANGVTVSADGTKLFVSEHLARKILAFDIEADGSLSNERTYLDLKDYGVQPDPHIQYVGPDGLATDAAGNIYIAIYGGGRILIIGPDKVLRSTIEVPEQYVTSAELTADGRTLLITAPGENARWPLLGKVYETSNPIEK